MQYSKTLPDLLHLSEAASVARKAKEATTQHPNDDLLGWPDFLSPIRCHISLPAQQLLAKLPGSRYLHDPISSERVTRFKKRIFGTSAVSNLRQRDNLSSAPE